MEGGRRRGRNWGSTAPGEHITAGDPIWGQGMAEMAPRCARAAQGIGGCVYFRVYGKRLEQAHTQHHRERTPPFKEVGRRAAGVWLTRRRKGENTNLSALVLSGRRLRSCREPLTCHGPDSPVPAQPPASPGPAESRRRNRRFLPCEFPPVIRAEHQPEVDGWTSWEGWRGGVLRRLGVPRWDPSSC